MSAKRIQLKREYVLEQIERGYLDPGMAAVPSTDEQWPDWDILDGFKLDGHTIGYCEHAENAAAAIEALWLKVHSEGAR